MPELLNPITDLGVIQRHRALVDVLMGGIFPSAFFDQEFSAVLIPFMLKSFYATPPFEQLLQAEDGSLRGRVNLDPAMISAMRLFFAYALVLDRIYGVQLDVDYPLILTTTDTDTGLERHFKMDFDWRFVEVETIGPVPDADRRDAAAPARRALRDRSVPRGPAGGSLRVPRLHDLPGDRGHGSGSAVLARSAT